MNVWDGHSCPSHLTLILMLTLTLILILVLAVIFVLHRRSRRIHRDPHDRRPGER